MHSDTEAQNLVSAEVDPSYYPNRTIAPAFFDRVYTRLVTRESFEPVTAAKATNDAFAFVQLVAEAGGPGKAFTPTKVVDQAWHAAILFTRDYANLCAKLGRFVHHEPHDHPVGGTAAAAAVLTTVEAFAETDLQVNSDLWEFALEVDSASNCCAAGGSCGGCWG